MQAASSETPARPIAAGLNGEAARAVAALTPLARAVVNLKRVRSNRADAQQGRSWTERCFAQAWTALTAGADVEAVAHRALADALAAARLGDIDAATIAAHGASENEAHAACLRAFDEAAAPLDADLRATLRAYTGQAAGVDGEEPAFVEALVRQPRAGATHPGVPRLVLEPAESHADHAMSVALLGGFVAPAFGADPSRVVLTGLAHHLFNVTLPDAGYAADALLGEDLLGRMMEAATDRALADLPDALRANVEAALAATREDAFGTPEADAFHAADVLDRVLEMAWHARAARFRLRDALGEDTAAGQLNIVHAGFPQAFQRAVLHAAALWPPERSADAAPPASLEVMHVEHRRPGS